MGYFCYQKAKQLVRPSLRKEKKKKKHKVKTLLKANGTAELFDLIWAEKESVPQPLTSPSLQVPGAVGLDFTESLATG